MTATATGVHGLKETRPARGGTIAVCSCGWGSSPYVADAAAVAAHAAHSGWFDRPSRTVAPETARVRKQAGQDRSLWDATSEDVDVMRAAVRKVAPGDDFTANDLRPDLDAAGIDPGKRAALLRQVVAEGLAQPVTYPYRGKDYPIRIPSTGDTANAATVVVYRRLGPTPEVR